MIRFFHPRKDRWLQCFALVNVRIEAHNEIGEVTQKILQLNHPNRVRERTLLARIGRYPTIEALARMKE